MSDQYLTCDWVIQPLRQPSGGYTSILNMAYQTAEEAGCMFITAKPYQDGEGLYIMPLIWKGALREQLDISLELIQTYMRLRNIRVATQDEIRLFEQQLLSADTGLLALIHYIDEAGLYNEQLLANKTQY
jgi:hypothetical protein